jgi:hypothetical protein
MPENSALSKQIGAIPLEMGTARASMRHGCTKDPAIDTNSISNRFCECTSAGMCLAGKILLFVKEKEAAGKVFSE